MGCGKVAGHLDVNCWGDGELDFFFNSVLMRSKRGSKIGHEILSEHTHRRTVVQTKGQGNRKEMSEHFSDGDSERNWTGVSKIKTEGAI